MGLIDRLRAAFTPVPVERDAWGVLNFNGNTYPITLNQTLHGTEEKIGTDYVGLGDGTLKSNPVVFACMNARMSLFSEARFMYRRQRSGTPGELWSDRSLELLRHPWPGGTTGDLLARTMQDGDLAGNAIWVRRPNRLARLRPDWATFIHGSYNDPDVDMWDVDAELLGIAYHPGGPYGGKGPIFFQPSEFAHYAPIPDPIAPARGISWLTALIREIQADSQMTTHKQAYLTNGATPNLVLTGVPGNSLPEYQQWVDKFSKSHDGAHNAYKSLYLTAAMDAKVLGSDMAQMDFKSTQGIGETRIAAAAGVPAAVVGISEGLAGSSLNAGNFAASMRRFADLTMRPLWRNVCGSFEQIVPVPGDSELWYDDRDIPALKDDIKDAADVRAADASAMSQLISSGWEPESIVAAIAAGDWKRLQHTGLYSVQLQPPMPDGPAAPEPTPDPVPPARDAGLWRLVDAAERRALLAENRPDPVINVTTAPVTVNTPEQPVTLTIERGAVEVSAPVTVEPAVVNVHTPEVRNQITVDPTPVEITVEPSAVEVRNDVTVSPTPVEINVAAPAVTVEAPDVTVNVPEPRATTKTIVREGGQITQIIEEPTDG